MTSPAIGARNQSVQSSASSPTSDRQASTDARRTMQARNSDRACLARIPDAPVFRPTAEEFADPMEYIRSIWAQGAAAGLCKIIPPSSWYSSAGPSTFPDSMRFKTRLQEVHKLRHRHRGVAERFSTFVEQWHRAQSGDLSSSLVFPPVVRCKLRPAGKPADYDANVDLYQLYMVVQRLAGDSILPDADMWRAVVASLYLPSDDENVCAMVEDIYVMYLLPLPDLDVIGSLFPELPDSKLHPSVRRNRPGQKTVSRPSPSRISKQCGADVAPLTKDDFRSVLHSHNTVFCNGCDKRLDSANCFNPEMSAKSLNCSSCGAAYHPACFPGSQLDAKRKKGSSVATPVCSASCGFGFSTAKRDIQLREYRAQSNDVKRRWLKQLRSSDGLERSTDSPVAWQDIEREYWKIVEDPTRAVYVHYGSDLDTKMTGSGFPPPSSSQEGEGHSLDPWNLNIFPSVSGSLLKYFHDSIKGINVPWLYCGSMFSTFCYHTEDLNMMSVNYMHLADEGGGKVWYGAPPGAGALDFESALRSAAPELFAAQPDLVFQLLTMVSPVELQARGTVVCRTVQRPGEFVLTFPQGFHGGFSLGFNIAEAVNFFTPECLPWMRAAVYRCHLYRKEPVFCIPQFLMSLISKIGLHRDLCSTDVNYILTEATKFVEMERSARYKVVTRLWGMSTCLSRKEMSQAHLNRQNELCMFCRQPCFFSGVMRNSDKSILCIDCAIERDDWILDSRDGVSNGHAPEHSLASFPYHILLFVTLFSVESALEEGGKIALKSLPG